MRQYILAASVAVAVLTTPVFALTQAGDTAGTAPTASQATATPDPDEEIRCRRVAVTGTLISRNRVCKTVGEWRRLAERGNDVARAVVGSGNVCAGGSCGNGG